MSYQALLFCPDEKTARVVTQVLTELDFTVEPCNEPFAAVKKLMAQHFDAVVVDCDNEQNATLLFKSARNSGTNQSSLSVAMVEGQAGVAKAFRIGANLVLTKPINVEQSKGTLRVARGLLRKGEAGAKAAPETPARPAPSIVPTPTMPPPKQPLPSLEQPLFSPQRPAEPPAPAASSSLYELEAEHTPEPEPAEAALLESMPDPIPAASSLPSGSASKDYPWQPMNKLSEPMASALKRAAEVAGTSKPSQEEPESSTSSTETAKQQTPVSAESRGVSSQGAAAAPAKEAPAKTIEFKAPAKFTPAQEPKEEDVAPKSISFEPPTFGTLAVKDHEQISDDEQGKSPFIWVAVAAVVIVGAYFGWTKMHTSVRPSTAAPMTQSATPAPSAVTPPSATVTATPLPPTNNNSAAQNEITKPAKPSPAETVIASTNKPTPDEEPVQPAPMVVKKDQPHASGTKSAELEVPQAPGVLGLSGSSDQQAISGIVANTPVAVPRVSSQTLKVSQGVSQGLLVKRVQPTYPEQALQMRVQGAVEMQASIGKDGSITSVKVIKGDSILARAAVAAVKQWKYKPYFLNGEPAAVQTDITVNFKLP